MEIVLEVAVHATVGGLAPTVTKVSEHLYDEKYTTDNNHFMTAFS